MWVESNAAKRKDKHTVGRKKRRGIIGGTSNGFCLSVGHGVEGRDCRQKAGSPNYEKEWGFRLDPLIPA